jgi:hypothetical protein
MMQSRTRGLLTLLQRMERYDGNRRVYSGSELDSGKRIAPCITYALQCDRVRSGMAAGGVKHMTFFNTVKFKVK